MKQKTNKQTKTKRNQKKQANKQISNTLKPMKNAPPVVNLMLFTDISKCSLYM